MQLQKVKVVQTRDRDGDIGRPIYVYDIESGKEIPGVTFLDYEVGQVYAHMEMMVEVVELQTIEE